MVSLSRARMGPPVAQRRSALNAGPDPVNARSQRK